MTKAILPDLPSWDIRRYGDTRIAIKVTHETALAEGEDYEAGYHSIQAILKASRSPRTIGMSDSSPSREFAPGGRRALAAGGLPGALGRRLRPRLDSGPNAG